MAVYRYPQEVHDFVKEHCTEMRDMDLAEECNRMFGTEFTAKKMKCFRGNHGYHNGMKQWTSEEYWKYQTYFPKGMYEFIRDNSWGTPSADLAQMVNEKFGTHFTPKRMKDFRIQHGIKGGEKGWYQVGRSPGNKGRKQSEYCSPEAIEASRRTQFKKGQKPIDEKPVGTIVVTCKGYKKIKVQMEGTIWERWRPLHRWVWEQHFGEIPKGKEILFKDGDRLNCDIGNLMLATHSEKRIMKNRGYHSEDPELAEAAVYMVRLSLEAKKRRKKHDAHS